MQKSSQSQLVCKTSCNYVKLRTLQHGLHAISQWQCKAEHLAARSARRQPMTVQELTTCWISILCCGLWKVARVTKNLWNICVISCVCRRYYRDSCSTLCCSNMHTTNTVWTCYEKIEKLCGRRHLIFVVTGIEFVPFSLLMRHVLKPVPCFPLNVSQCWDDRIVINSMITSGCHLCNSSSCTYD